MEIILIIILIAANLWLSYGHIKRFLKKRRDQKRVKDYLADVEEYSMIQIYKDSLGNNWYAFKNPLKLPAMRSIAGEAAARQAEMNMDSETLHEFIMEMEKEANQGKITNMMAIFGKMKERLTWAFEEKTMENLAVNYFVLEGEPVQVLSDKWIEKKREILASDIEAKAFFLSAAFKYTKTIGDISSSDILKYLTEKAVKGRE